MGREILAEKIILLRKQKGLSQEELANASFINLRTLQRIETGKTEPRGHTLRMLSKALDTPFESFVDIKKEEDTRFLQTMNLSALSFWIVPFGNIFLPLILWGIRDNRNQNTDERLKWLLKFQLARSLLVYGYVYIGILGHGINLPIGISIIQFILALYILNSAVILISVFQLRRGKGSLS